ncbi:hypothetical protein [Salinibacter phage M31CR41-2]|uniref:Uncharacterized protein n=1 Tax=Salinibacter phage M31CR41-2 TaxID=2681614 RepID=A0A2I6UHA9_9CAUD|nr:hypothetical protein FGG68_gp70 [Salinibacter phage M31CR41-2]AUO79326.1 hypothetical protein [Salinibacter phage M31CR41-2]AUO79395.1 hypothetical protein [Salinibacter virus M31CR41-3]
MPPVNDRKASPLGCGFMLLLAFFMLMSVMANCNEQSQPDGATANSSTQLQEEYPQPRNTGDSTLYKGVQM